MTGASIIVPTYNEKENIPELFKRINSAIKPDSEYEIIVVDDDSPDETWRIASEYSDQYPVTVMRRKEEKGLATAVIRGIEEASYEIVVVMDADFQHPPEKIPELVSRVEEGADISIGSRYVEGGSLGDFGFFRKMISRGADFIAKTIFRDIRDVSDIQTGFFTLRKKILDGVELDPTGYKILLEILVQGEYNRVEEVGYEFEKRKEGESKLGVGTVFSYLRHLIGLSFRSGEFFRFLKFCIVGGSGTVMNLGILYLLTTSGFYYLYSGALAIEAGLLTNFFINNVWTFGDVEVSGVKNLGKALFRDHIVRSGGIVINMVILWILTDYVGLYYMLSQILGIAIATIWNYGGNKWLTWRQEE